MLSTLKFTISSNIFELIGYIVFTIFVLKHSIVPFYKLITLPFKRTLPQRYGINSWALVTGASDGIGKGFCQQLAREGFNIILVARNKEKLKNVASEIREENPGIKTHIIVFNFTESYKQEAIDCLMKEAATFDVSILVNNVGISLSESYHIVPEKELMDAMIINLFPILKLTREFIPIMLKRKTKSAIINLGSLSGTRPLPYLAAYSGSKVLCDFVTRAIQVEYSKIDFLALNPLYVSTPGVNNRPLGPDTISPIDCAKGALDDLGYVGRSYGYWKHKMIGTIIEMIPDFIFSKITLKSGLEQIELGRGLRSRMK